MPPFSNGFEKSREFALYPDFKLLVYFFFFSYQGERDALISLSRNQKPFRKLLRGNPVKSRDYGSCLKVATAQHFILRVRNPLSQIKE